MRWEIGELESLDRVLAGAFGVSSIISQSGPMQVRIGFPVTALNCIVQERHSFLMAALSGKGPESI